MDALLCLRQRGRHVVADLLLLQAQGIPSGHRHVYGRSQNGDAGLPSDCIQVNADPQQDCSFSSWVLCPQELRPSDAARHKLTWAWSPIDHQPMAPLAITSNSAPLFSSEVAATKTVIQPVNRAAAVISTGNGGFLSDVANAEKKVGMIIAKPCHYNIITTTSVIKALVIKRSISIMSNLAYSRLNSKTNLPSS
ncbi:MAG: hypothetical protein GY805_11285 [Chloroflexi bacterium]|nr:hypothetical protein [Chloroflexota bacterium]